MNVVLPSPYEAQLEVLRSCFDNVTEYIVLNGSRQVGKTLISTFAALKWALETKEGHIMIVSPTDGQVKKVYKQMLQMVTPLLFYIKNFKAASGDSEIVFKNGSQILFRSAAAENTLRGYSNTHLILDECAFIKEETWNTILAPSLSVRGKKTLFCSTPKGNNFFSRLYHKGLTDGLKYKSFKLTYHNNPYCNIHFINEQKATLPDEIFRQEYLGEFIDAAGCFSNTNDIAILKRQPFDPKEQYYIGVDIAFKKDYTVAVCLNSKKEMVDYIRFNQTDIGSIMTNLKAFFAKWKPKKLMIESNNQGLPIIQQLQREGVNNIEPFATTAQSKPLIINRLVAAFGKKEIKVISDEIVKGEFNAFTATLSKTGTVKFEAAFGHDDIVMATAIALECALTNAYTKSFVVAK